jgi:hypothetical protein
VDLVEVVEPTVTQVVVVVVVATLVERVKHKLH